MAERDTKEPESIKDVAVEPEPRQILDRREFVRLGALATVGAAVVGSALIYDRLNPPANDVEGEASIRKLDGLSGIPSSESEDPLVRMQRELARGMAKPMEQRQWVMVIDTRKCVGCHACTIGCVAENKLPPGVVYRPVVTEEAGKFPNVQLRFTPRPCMQCDAPPCVPVCPVKATWKRKDGIVAIDYDKCIGCRYCLTACPYGARTSDFGEYYTDGVAEGVHRNDPVRPLDGARSPYEELPNHEYHKKFSRAKHGSPMGNARKCHFCLHRLEEGMLPMCATTCIGRATYFGDAADPESLVSELIAKHRCQTLLPEKGTHPRVYYIV